MRRDATLTPSPFQGGALGFGTFVGRRMRRIGPPTGGPALIPAAINGAEDGAGSWPTGRRQDMDGDTSAPRPPTG